MQRAWVIVAPDANTGRLEILQEANWSGSREALEELGRRNFRGRNVFAMTREEWAESRSSDGGEEAGGDDVR